MQKAKIFLIIFLIMSIMSISGCFSTKKINNTWGEKKISLDSIKLSKNTTGNRSKKDDNLYYVKGHIMNDNPIEAINPKIKITTYYINGTVFAVNDTPYVYHNNIPGKGSSYFYARFHDPDKLIYNFTVEILDAKGEYWS